VQARLVDRFPRFRQRVVESALPIGGFGWEDDPDFELASHLERGRLPAPGDHRALERLLGEMMAVPLDRGRPHWQLQLVDGYGGGCALVARFHHCIADPLTLAGVRAADRRAARRRARAAGRRRAAACPPGRTRRAAGGACCRRRATRRARCSKPATGSFPTPLS
jgi:diacylglycerol O-acyltransferase / wax synthase